jgi:hypothetical protein
MGGVMRARWPRISTSSAALGRLRLFFAMSCSSDTAMVHALRGKEVERCRDELLRRTQANHGEVRRVAARCGNTIADAMTP